MNPKADNNKLTMPLGPAYLHDAMVTTCKQQVATIQSCADYPNEPDVQARAVATLSDANALGQALVDLGAAKLLVATLEGQRDQLTVSLRSNHTALVGTLNVACKGKVANIKAWGGAVATRTARPMSTDPPTLAMVTITRTMGTVLARCKAERGVLGYMFQYGTDPANPDAWPKAELVPRSRFRVADLAIGQKVYFRIAVVRRNGGQGQWSGLLEVTAR
jgi:hypothetical protein